MKEGAIYYLNSCINALILSEIDVEFKIKSKISVKKFFILIFVRTQNKSLLTSKHFSGIEEY